MNKALSKSRDDVGKHTPKMEKITVDKKDIATVIGKGGATIREIVEKSVVIPSKWLKWLKKGHPVKIIIDETGEVLDATVISLGAAVDAASQTIELKAQFNEKYESLIPGMSGIVKF